MFRIVNKANSRIIRNVFRYIGFGGFGGGVPGGGDSFSSGFSSGFGG